MCSNTSDEVADKDSDWPIPNSLSKLEWRATVLVIAYNEYGFGRPPQESNLGFTRRIDWIETLGNRFAAIYSSRNQTALNYRLWFGEHEGGGIALSFLASDGVPLTETKKSMEWYVKALETDSLWLLFSARPFWNSVSDWDTFYESHKYTKLGNLNYELGMDCRPGYLAPPRFQAPQLSEEKVFRSDLGLPFAFAYDEPFGQYVGDQNTLTMLDYSALKGNKFTLIVCRRDEEKGAYAIAIGRLDGHLMTYRLIGNGIHTLEGKGLRDYIDLLVNDKISSLIGPEGFGESEESMNLLYDSFFNDSLTTEYQTRTLHLDSLFEDGYLERAVQ